MWSLPTWRMYFNSFRVIGPLFLRHLRRSWRKHFFLSSNGVHCLSISAYTSFSDNFSSSVNKNKWASAWQNQQNCMCGQRRLRSAWASALFDQSLRYALSGYLRTQAFFMQTAKTDQTADAQTDLGAHAILLVFSCIGWYCYYTGRILRIDKIIATTHPVKFSIF